MIVHVVFQILLLLLGIALMVLSLMLDVELTREKCDSNVVIRECSRGLLAMGTLLFSIVLTIMIYSFMMATAGISRLNHPTYNVLLIYVIFLLLLGITVIVLTVNNI